MEDNENIKGNMFAKKQESNSEVISEDESKKCVPVLFLNIACYSWHSFDSNSVWETEQQQRRKKMEGGL